MSGSFERTARSAVIASQNLIGIKIECHSSVRLRWQGVLGVLRVTHVVHHVHVGKWVQVATTHLFSMLRGGSTNIRDITWGLRYWWTLRQFLVCSSQRSGPQRRWLNTVQLFSPTLRSISPYNIQGNCVPGSPSCFIWNVLQKHCRWTFVDHITEYVSFIWSDNIWFLEWGPLKGKSASHTSMVRWQC